MTLVAFSKPVKYCLEAAEILAKEGISCEVIKLACSLTCLLTVILLGDLGDKPPHDSSS